MKDDLWTAVDSYLNETFALSDDALEAALRASEAAGLPAISVSPSQGKLLHLLARFGGARRILEIGTLGGYSTIWLARALPADGRLITLELDAKHAEVASANIARAGLADRVELRLGPALDSLTRMAREGTHAFDFIFIDADKVGYPEYLLRSIELARPGALIVADNVIRDGAVADAASKDPSVVAVRRMHEILAHEIRVSAVALQTVGSKGYDGFTVALVNGAS